LNVAVRILVSLSFKYVATIAFFFFWRFPIFFKEYKIKGYSIEDLLEN
jgi:Na+/glutamate symporter